MKNLLFASVAVAATALTASGPASAADLPIAMPVKASPTAAVAYANGFYAWADGSSQSIHLPTFSLGWRAADFVTAFDRGPYDSYNPRATGSGIRGGLGYIFGDGTFPSAFGSNVRIELGASYVRASKTQAGGVGAIPGPGVQTIELLSGVMGVAPVVCGLSCGSTASTLSSRYRDWQVNLKVASDFKLAGVTLTPSVAVFGGDAHNDQSFGQQVLPGAVNYSATSALRWDDWGAKFGLNANVDVTSWLGFGLGGSLGVAGRDVNLSANDAFGVLTSAVAATRTTTPFLGNAEASVTVRPLRNVAIRGFVGLDYDSDVPGLSTPTFAGPAIGPTSVTPAGIKFEAETSYYAGGGVTVKFAP